MNVPGKTDTTGIFLQGGIVQSPKIQSAFSHVRMLEKLIVALTASPAEHQPKSHCPLPGTHKDDEPQIRLASVLVGRRSQKSRPC